MSENPKIQNSMNLSFAGCGFLGMYHVGVASCIREYAPQILLNKISGASAGALAAVALLCDVPLGESTSDILKMVVKARKKTLGPFHPGFDLTRSLRDGLLKMLPDDAYLRCTDRLHISVTRVSDGENVLLTNFNNNEELMTALLCSCFVPVFSGFVPLKFRGVAYADGGFSDNLPILDENTITVSPFSGESDICPQDNYFNFMQINLCNTSIAISPTNLYRFTRILFPSPPEVLSKMCQQGFDDALKFLQRNSLSSCTRCLAVQSSFVLSSAESSSSSDMEEEEEAAEVNTSQSIITTDETEDESYSDSDHTWDDCKDCRLRLQQMADGDSLPDAVVVAIQDACDQLNKGIVNWLFRHRTIKFLYFMTVPYVLPFDITVAMLRRVLQLIPKAKQEMQQSFWNLVNFARNLLHKFDTNRHLYSAKFSCQLAITEYNYSEEQNLVSYSNRVDCSYQPQLGQCFVTDSSNSGRRRRSLDLGKTKQIQRRSYAGYSANEQVTGSPNPRRKSLVEKFEQEKVISTMNFGFTVGVTSNMGTSNKKRQNVMEAFKTLGNENTDMNAIDMANKALNWERECLERCSTVGRNEQPNSESFETILDVTNKHEALMAFYFMDNDNRVKVTEIFNVTDADTSAILSKDERELNNDLQWDSDDNWSDELGGNDSLLQSSFETVEKDQRIDFSDDVSGNFEFDSSIEDDFPADLLEPTNITKKDFCESLEDSTDSSLKRKSSFVIASQ